MGCFRSDQDSGWTMDLVRMDGWTNSSAFNLNKCLLSMRRVQSVQASECSDSEHRPDPIYLSTILSMSR